VLSTTAFANNASRDELDAWVNSVELTVTTVMEGEGQDRASLQAFGIREALVIVELPSMTVVHYDPGDQSGTLDPSVVVGLAKLHELLHGGT
jgi:hypothetical protein